MIRILHAPHHSDAPLEVALDDEADTLALGAALATALAPGLKIELQGNLGAGKTTLVRGLLRALGHHGPVKSPTYTLIEPYSVSRLDLYHFDFYRFTQPEEFLDAGLDEYFTGPGICLMEWPDKARPYLPPADLVLRLQVSGTGRTASLTSLREAGRTCLNTLAHTLVRSMPDSPSSSGAAS